MYRSPCPINLFVVKADTRIKYESTEEYVFVVFGKKPFKKIINFNICM